MVITKIEVMKFYDGTVSFGRINTNPQFSIKINKEDEDDVGTIMIQNRNDERGETFSVDVESMNLPDSFGKRDF